MKESWLGVEIGEECGRNRKRGRGGEREARMSYVRETGREGVESG